MNNSSEDFLKFLNTREISLGLKIKVLAVEAFDGSMTVVFQQNRQEVLSKMVCDRLLVNSIKVIKMKLMFTPFLVFCAFCIALFMH